MILNSAFLSTEIKRKSLKMKQFSWLDLINRSILSHLVRHIAQKRIAGYMYIFSSPGGYQPGGARGKKNAFKDFHPCLIFSSYIKSEKIETPR